MGEGQTLSKGRVLVADDDRAILRLLKEIIEREGFTAVTALDGKEAYKLLQSDEVFDAAIFDVIMPHIKGPDLVKYMQSEEDLKGIPVILMTAEVGSKLSSEGMIAGAAAFLPKPFSARQVRMMLQMFTKKKKTTQI